MKMFKRILCISLALLCVIPLFGCHGSRGKAEFKTPLKFDTSKNYEITFWAKNDTNLTQVAIYEKAVADFEKLYPNIKVNLRLYTDYARIYQDVITNIATDTTPNVCITYPDHIATYMKGQNTVVPLDNLLFDEKYGLGGSDVKFDSPTADQIIPKFLDEGVIDGVQYAIPFMRSTELCYVNKTYVEKLGFTLPEKLTWDFIWQVADAAAEKDAEGKYIVNGQTTMIPFIYKSTDNMMIQMLRQLDAGYSTDDGEIQLFNDTTRSLLHTVAEHTATGGFCTFKIVGYPANFLNAGQCIFAIDSSAGATWMGSDAPNVDIPEQSLVQFETIVMELPQFDVENPKMISQGPSVCVFNKEDEQEVLASWLFAQFLLTNDVQIAYSQTEGYAPVTSKAQNSAEYVDYLSRAGEDNDMYYYVKLQATKMLMENTENTFVTPVFDGSATLRNEAGALIEEVTKAVRRKKTVDDSFIDDLYAEAQFRLERVDDTVSGKKEFDKLPDTAVVLISSIGIAWAFIIVYFVYDLIKKRKKSQK